jgi:hypothetical protein
MNDYVITPSEIGQDKAFVIQGKDDELLGMFRLHPDGTIWLRSTIKLVPFQSIPDTGEKKIF